MLMRKEQAALARKNIVDAAENLIKEKGYEDIHIADITSACNMSTGNFYHYFKSKDELFTEIDNNKFYESLSALKSDINSPALSRLESYILEWIELMITYYGSNYMYYWVRHYVHKSLPSDADDSRISLIYGHILHILEKGIENNELRKDTPVECIAFSIAFTIFGCAAHFGLTDDRDLIRQWTRNYCDIYIRSALNPYRIN